MTQKLHIRRFSCIHQREEEECSVEKIIFTAGILLLPAVCTTVGAAGAFLFRRAQEPRTQRMTSGMAAGIMLAASVWSLLLPAIERAERSEERR